MTTKTIDTRFLTRPAAAVPAARPLSDDPFAWQKMGVFHQNAGHFALAAECFEQAMAVRSADGLADILARLADVYLKMGLPALAQSCLLDALAERPGDAALLQKLAAMPVA